MPGGPEFQCPAREEGSTSRITARNTHSEPFGEPGEINRARPKTVRPSNSSRIQAQEHKSESRTLVGGPGFEPGASRSRTVSVACPRVSRRLRKGPADLKCPVLADLA